MSIEKKFVKKALDDLRVKTFLRKELERAGVSSIEIQKTPIATRVTLFVRKPGMVVGKKGAGIRELCDQLETGFGIENPQIEVVEVMQPSLDAQLVAEKVGKRLEVKPNIKPILRFALAEIMDAGAIGGQIRAAGKIVGKGGKAKVITVRAGYLKKSGDMLKLVRKGRYIAYLKAGAVGITVKIVPPGAVFPDRIEIKELVEEKKEVPIEVIEETVEEKVEETKE
jgi:small subunit ribosomal protein S3